MDKSNQGGITINSHLGRRSLRLPNYDYSQIAAYFITICTHKKRILLAEIVEDEARRNKAGHIVQSIWESLHKRFPMIQTDAFVVMPNHIHGIIIIKNDVGAIHAVSHPVRDASPVYAGRTATARRGETAGVPPVSRHER